MREQIRNALDLIDVPNDLEDSVREGIGRAKRERNGISMKRSVKKIATIAAAFALLVGIAAGAAGLSNIHINKIDDSEENPPDNISQFENLSGKASGLSVRLLGVTDDQLTVSVSNVSADSRFEGLTDIDLGTYALVDKNGNIIASDSDTNSKYDIEVAISVLNAEIDINATDEEVFYQMREQQDAFDIMLNALQNEYKIYISSLTGVDEKGNIIEIEGHWESEIRFDTVLDGSAFVADGGDVDIEFVKKEDGTQDLVITMNNTSKYPYNEVVKIWPTVYVVFDSNGTIIGGNRDYVDGGPSSGGGSGFIEASYEDGNYTIITADKGDYSIYICDFGIELTNGERYELQGSWRAGFVGEREPRTARQQYIDAYKRILENAEKLGNPGYALRWRSWALEMGIIDPETGEVYDE